MPRRRSARTEHDPSQAAATAPLSEASRAFWQDRPVCVTGATGLVGSWVVKRLLALGADIVCVVRDWVPQSELVRSGAIDPAPRPGTALSSKRWGSQVALPWGGVKVVRGDVRDQPLLERVFGEQEIDAVIHLAAQTIVGVANRNPISTFETNIQGTWSLLEACRRSPSVKQVVIASSDKAYGDQERLPYEEAAPLQGQHPYDVSKSCADLLAHTYATTYHLPVCITRCGNFYGGGDLNWNRIVPGTIRSVLRGARPVIRSDGSFVRDYIYVEDAAAAYTLLIERLAGCPDLRGEAFNFSNERPMTVLELVTTILSLMGSTLEPEIRNDASHEIKAQYLSARKAKELLHWQPLFSLEEGLRRTIRWYETFLGTKATRHAIRVA